MRRFTWLLGLFYLTALLAGCSTGAPSFPAYSTMDQALGKVLNQQVAIAYDEEFGANRRLVLFRTDRNPGLSLTLLERTDWDQWRMTDAVGLRSGLNRLGALTYDSGSIGRVTEQHGNSTTERAEALVVYGEALDPGITWVELTLDNKGAEPIRTTVKDGLWLVKLPPENQFTAFDLRAGDANGRRFATTVGVASVNSRDLDPETAPLVEYQDLQQGLRLQYPAMAFPRIDENGRLVLSFSPWTISVERKPVQGNQSLAEQLKAAVGGGQLLEEGTRPLGVHQAAFLLESRPEADGRGSVFHAHYMVRTGGSTYTVTCSTTRVFSHGFWEKNLKPVCDRVLATISLGDE